MTTTATTNPPVDRVRLGAIQAAIWRNEDDEGRVRYGVTVERIYRDGEGAWQSTASFGRDELLTLAKVADLANTRIHELQAEDREAKQSEGATKAATTRKARAR